MKKSTKTSKLTAALIATSAIILLTACSDSIFEKKVDEAEKVIKETEKSKKENDQINNPENVKPADVKLSEEQLEALEKDSNNKSKTAEEAVADSELPVREVMEKNIPVAKAVFTDVNELAQYVSQLFFLFHTSQISGKEFYEKISPYFSTNFKEMLPTEEKEQIQTMNTLQAMFLKQLNSPIVEYQITDVEVESRVDEAGMYRKYITKDKNEIYYESIFIKEDKAWLLFDDSPSPPYVIDPTIENKFRNKEGK